MRTKESLFVCFCFLLIGAHCQDKTDKPETPAEIQNDENSNKGNNTDNNSTDDNSTERTKKLFSFLQVMKFPNDVCVGTASRNGTCYSSDECTSKGGTASGNCANGFGVCCVFILGCGQTSSENNTFLVLASTTTPTPSVCTYTLCESNPNICRIRLDFTTFSINGPAVGTTVVSTVTAGQVVSTTGGAIGDCNSDQFTVTSPNNHGSPVICGINTGQHMIIDTSSSACAKVNFDFGSASFARSYDIRVTQYNCNDEMAGPNDCLQYFTGNTGTVFSYNFALTAGAVGATTTHLSNQNYNICFRRNVGKCAICFTPSKVPAAPAAIDQQSFGLSNQAISINAANMPAKSGVDNICSTDYLVIPNGATQAMAVAITANHASRFCGRALSPAENTLSTAATIVSVCTGQRPFKITFVTDQNEASNVDAIAMMDANVNELNGVPGGIVGFSLDFSQISC